jgi:hypothetical protein
MLRHPLKPCQLKAAEPAVRSKLSYPVFDETEAQDEDLPSHETEALPARLFGVISSNARARKSRPWPVVIGPVFS